MPKLSLSSLIPHLSSLITNKFARPTPLPVCHNTWCMENIITGNFVSKDGARLPYLRGCEQANPYLGKGKGSGKNMYSGEHKAGSDCREFITAEQCFEGEEGFRCISCTTHVMYESKQTGHSPSLTDPASDALTLLRKHPTTEINKSAQLCYLPVSPTGICCNFS